MFYNIFSFIFSSQNKTQKGLLARYNKLLAQKKISTDSSQKKIVTLLQKTLEDYKGWRYFFSPLPKGIYLWGKVGRGKSFLSNLLYESLEKEKKQRFHSQFFFDMLHKNLKDEDMFDHSLKKVAKDIAQQAKILYIDEFEITNIADAILLKNLFKWLSKYKVFIILTSNVAPKNIYSQGLNRDRITTLLTYFSEKFLILELKGDQDYRRQNIQNYYFAPLDENTDKQLLDIWFRLINNTALPAKTFLDSPAKLKLRALSNETAWVDFTDICCHFAGAPDYIKLASQAKLIIISNIPLLSEEASDAVLRLITLIDILYEKRVKLILSAITQLELLYVKGPHVDIFQRALSRLYEMQYVDIN